MTDKPRCPLCKREISGKSDRNCKASFDETLGGDIIGASNCKGDPVEFNVRTVLRHGDEVAHHDENAFLLKKQFDLVVDEKSERIVALEAALRWAIDDIEASRVNEYHERGSGELVDFDRETQAKLAELRKLVNE